MKPTAPGRPRASGARSDGELGVGQVIAGRYRVVRRIGAGAYGTVFEVEHTALGKHFALKLLNAQARRDQRTITRFEAEAVTASRIDHPNIVSVTDIGHTEQGHGFYVMELLEGQTLAQILREGRLRASRAIPILAATSHAVGAAHAASVIHRDLKPDNVFIVPQEDIQSGRTREVVRILDFGLAKVTESASFTIEGVTYGTPAYMAPEQVQGKKVDGRADIYSIGCIAYEMFAGRPLFSGPALEVALAHVEQPPPPLVDAPSKRVRVVIERCLEKDPARRYSTCEALLDDLRAIAMDLLRPDGTTKQLERPSVAEIAAAAEFSEERTLSESGEWWDEFSDLASAIDRATGDTDEHAVAALVAYATDAGGPAGPVQTTPAIATLPTAPAIQPPPVPPSQRRVGADSVPAFETARTTEFRAEDLGPELLAETLREAPKRRPAPPLHEDIPREDAPRLAASELAALEKRQADGSESASNVLFQPDEATLQVDHLPPPAKRPTRPGRWLLIAVVVGLLAAAIGGGVFYTVYRLTAEPATAGLVVELEPATAELKVDGRVQLKTGAKRTLDGLKAPARVELKATNEACRPLTKVVAVEPGRVHELKLKLTCSE